MTTEVTIIADSISPTGQRLTTFQLRYQRFIHAELMTHRLFSRNASSSRAIPVTKMIEDLERDPAMPVFWGAAQKGMQAAGEIDADAISYCRAQWLRTMTYNIEIARHLVEEGGLHKQIANRILEPWAHINVVLTATDFENFFALRCHPDAQPEIKVLADMMRAAMAESTPKELQPGEWHLPFADREQDFQQARWHCKKSRITRDEPMYDELVDKVLKHVSVARCARVSYLTHDGRETTIEEDMALYERLVGGMPLHASPAEHQATPDHKERLRMEQGSWILGEYEHPEEHGNLKGWRQLRKMLPGEFTPG